MSGKRRAVDEISEKISEKIFEDLFDETRRELQVGLHVVFNGGGAARVYRLCLEILQAEGDMCLKAAKIVICVHSGGLAERRKNAFTVETGLTGNLKRRVRDFNEYYSFLVGVAFLNVLSGRRLTTSAFVEDLSRVIGGLSADNLTVEALKGVFSEALKW